MPQRGRHVRLGEMGRYGVIWEYVERYGGDRTSGAMYDSEPQTRVKGARTYGMALPSAAYGEIWRDMGRYGEMWDGAALGCLLVGVREAKVAQLSVAIGGEDDILELDVAMHHAPLVQMRHRGHRLREYRLGLRGRFRDSSEKALCRLCRRGRRELASHSVRAPRASTTSKRSPLEASSMNM